MTRSFQTLDSGKRESFSTGSVRDNHNGKGGYDMLPPRPIHRVALLYERGARKYDRHNWRKGMPFSRVMESLLRHAFQYLAGNRDEDHLAAVCWNAFAIMEYEECIAAGQLPAHLADLYQPKRITECTAPASISPVPSAWENQTAMSVKPSTPPTNSPISDTPHSYLT